MPLIVLIALLALPLVFLCLYFINTATMRKTVFALLSSASALADMALIYHVQTVLNTPDHGKVLSQFYLPLLIYLALALLGFFLYLRERKKPEN